MARLIPTIKYVCGNCGLQYDSVVEQCCGCRVIFDVDNDNSQNNSIARIEKNTAAKIESAKEEEQVDIKRCE